MRRHFPCLPDFKLLTKSRLAILSRHALQNKKSALEPRGHAPSMSVTTVRGLARWRASCLRGQQRCASSTLSKASPPPSSEPRPAAPRRAPVIRPYKPAAKKPPSTNSSSTNHPPQPDTLQTLWRRSWLPLSGAALLAGLLGFYIVGTLTASLQQCPCGSCSCSSSSSASSSSPPPHGHDEHDTIPTGRPPALAGDQAEQFDKELDIPEWWMGITKLRRRLADYATGDVLELAIGTGRNLEYYHWGSLAESPTTACSSSRSSNPTRGVITSFTGLDISPDMLDVARRRLAKTLPATTTATESQKAVAKSTPADRSPPTHMGLPNNRVRLVHSDAHGALPPAPAAAAQGANSNGHPKPYDTIIQTFGLCSVSDPVAVLCNLASAIKPNTGRIVLLEHGRGWSGLVNGLLDRNARKHFDKYGCWWNRDIEALVEEALGRTPGLEVVRLQRPNVLQMGTLVWVELRVGDGDGKTGK